MIKKLRQRPFCRPLFIWITGILLQSTFSCFIPGLLILLFPLGVIGCACLCSFGQKATCLYGARWVWGAAFTCLLLFLSIQKTAFSQVKSDEVPAVSTLQQLAKDEQERLLKPFENLRLSEREKSVLATITVGHRESMDKEVRSRFSVTGVAHILSVSGFHVAVVCGFLSFFFSFLPRGLFYRGVRYVPTVGLLWMFIYISGLETPAVRAGIMLTLYLTGRLLKRATDGYNTLAASAFCMLVYEPLYLFDIGFQLSYLAVLSILYIQPRLKRLINIRNPVLAEAYGWVTLTVAAQAGTAFLCLYYFGQFSLVFLFTNLPLALLSTLLIPAGLLWMLLPDDCFGYSGIQAVVEWLTRGMLGIVDAFSRVPYAVATCRFGFVALVVGYGFLLFLLLFWNNRRPKYLLTALAFLLILSVCLLFEKLKLCGM